MEKIDTIDETMLPKSVFGVTLADAVKYGENLDKPSGVGFINEPIRDTEQMTLWEFMGSKLPENDEREITSIMKTLAGEFC